MEPLGLRRNSMTFWAISSVEHHQIVFIGVPIAALYLRHVLGEQLQAGVADAGCWSVDYLGDVVEGDHSGFLLHFGPPQGVEDAVVQIYV